MQLDLSNRNNMTDVTLAPSQGVHSFIRFLFVDGHPYKFNNQ